MKQFAVLYRAAGGEGGAGMQAPEGEALPGADHTGTDCPGSRCAGGTDLYAGGCGPNRAADHRTGTQAKRCGGGYGTHGSRAIGGDEREQRLEHERQERERTLAEREAAVQRRELRAQAHERWHNAACPESWQVC